MARKRKELAQTSTLLDFFGRGNSAAEAREAKKLKVKDPTCPSKGAPAAKRDISSEIIVIDSSDEDDVSVSEVYPLTDVRVREPRKVPVPKDLSSHIKEDPMAESSNALSIQMDVVEAATENMRREPSPFGFPTMLATPEQSEAAVPSVSEAADCSHDGLASVIAQAPVEVDKARPEDDDWGMGDDELELVDYDPVIKEEDADSVDIDLTLEDEVAPAIEREAVESCPICEKELVGMDIQEIHNHVDECLNALPDAQIKSEPMPSTSSSLKPLRPLSALQSPHTPSPKPEDSSIGLVKQEDGASNIFSTLMTSYKENEAWKEASVVEDKNFRPTKANGGRRKAPFYKVMQGMPIAVDAFRYGTIPNVTAYFLTHAHSDHYTNLSAKWDSGPIYCSHGTANLIIHMLGVDPKWVHPLPMDVATTIPNTGGVQVTLIEANHCPGSCLFLFEGKQTVNAGDSAYKSPSVGSAKIFRYLHCGDFRACPQHVLHPAVKGKRIDHVYLDTTYLDPKYCFPPQPLVISACAELAKRLVQGKSVEDVSRGDTKPRTMAGWFTRVEKTDKGKEKAPAASEKILVVVGTYSIGKERIVKAIAKALNTKVYCDSRKAAILRCESDSELDALLTSDPKAAGVHLVPLAVIASDRLKTYMERWKGYYTKAIGFRPTGWTFSAPKGTDTLPSIPTVISRSQSRTFTHANLLPMRNSTSTLQVYGIPYSEHSSFFELTCFALSFGWGRMIATVNVGRESSRGKMAKWFERWEAERKKRGEVEVVAYRAPDYW